MKFSCTQENLNRGLQVVSHIASRSTNLPILQNVLIDVSEGVIVLASTNLEIGVRTQIRGKVEEGGKFTLPAQLFASYVNLITAEIVDCELEGASFHVKANGQQTIIKGEPASDFPILPEIEKTNSHVIPKQALELALQQTVISASIDETRPEIAGVLFYINETTLTLAATDSYRLAEKKLTVLESTQPSKLILPQRSAQELLRILQNSDSEKVTLYTTETQLACEVGDVEFVSRVIEGMFPDYEQIIPEQGNTIVTVPVAEFIKAIKGAALFSKTGINDIELIINQESNSVEIKSVNAQLGENTTALTVSVQGPSTTIVFNYRFMLDGLQQVKSDSVTLHINDSMSPAVCRPQGDDKYTYVIMPIKQ